jgi:hypothetical protein
MSLHSGSSALAHNLDRFDARCDFELVATESARLNVEPETIRRYRDLYGNEPVIVRVKGLVSQMPAYEAEVRFQLLGERVVWPRRVAYAAT